MNQLRDNHGNIRFGQTDDPQQRQRDNDEGEEKKEDDDHVKNMMDWNSSDSVMSENRHGSFRCHALEIDRAFSRIQDQERAVHSKCTKNEHDDDHDADEIRLQLPMDVMREICQSVADPVSLCRLAMTCRSFHQCVDQVAPAMWKYYYHHRWTRSVVVALEDSTTSATTSHNNQRRLDNNSNDDIHHSDMNDTASNSVDCWKLLYQQRHCQDQSIIALVNKVVETELVPQKYDFDHLHQRPGMLASTQVEDVSWKNALAKAGSNIMDVLCAIANQDETYPGVVAVVPVQHDSEAQVDAQQQLLRRKLQRFLAASIVFTLHCHEVVTNVSSIWEQIILIRHSAPRRNHHLDQPAPAALVADNAAAVAAMLHHPNNHHHNYTESMGTSSACYEEMAVLLAHALRPVPELVQRSSSIQQLRLLVADQMNSLAQAVRLEMKHRPEHSHYFRQQTSRPLPSSNDGLVILATIHQVLWSTTTTTTSSSSSSTRGFGLRARYPETREAAVESCSIQRVIQWSHHHHHHHDDDNTPPSNKGYRWCHPILNAIFYQAVARRLDMALEIIFCPRHCYPMLRYYDRTTNMLWFLDLITTPGRILSLRECQELAERLDLTCEDHSDEAHHDQPRNHPIDGPLQPNDNMINMNIHADFHLVHDTFWGQAPIEVTSVLYWLVAPLLLNRRRRRTSQPHHSDNEGHNDYNDNDALEDQPRDFLLGQLVEGNGGSLMKFLNERLVFFTAILSFSELIDD
jgi:hypothetical protein